MKAIIALAGLIMTLLLHGCGGAGAPRDRGGLYSKPSVEKCFKHCKKISNGGSCLEFDTLVAKLCAPYLDDGK